MCLTSKSLNSLDATPTNAAVFHAHGKLLLTGEYFVLDGALALALPTKPGQSLQVLENQSGNIHWTSYDADGTAWFRHVYNLNAIQSGQMPDNKDVQIPSERLLQIFKAMEAQKPGFFRQFQGLQIETRLEFPRQWGLGTSSTLIANLANWVGIDPFQLLRDTFGGSGYDIACANSTGPIVYQLQHGQPFFSPENFHPAFAKQLYFIYLGKKQDSREGIVRYRKKVRNQPELVARMSSLTSQLLTCKTLVELEDLIRRHEAIVAETLRLPRARDLYFRDFWGEVKSLGAWGGDFVLVTSERSPEETKFYFNEKGFAVVLRFEDLVL